MGGRGGEVGGAGELGAGNGLVGAFATGGDGVGGRGESFAGEGVVRDVGDEIDVEGAEDGDARGGGHGGRGEGAAVRPLWCRSWLI